MSRGRRSAAGDTFIVFGCGEGYANLCGTVPETGELRQLTVDGDPNRSGSGSYVRFHRGYHGPSLSRDGRRLSFAFEGSAYIARQNAKARVRVGKLTKVGFTSMRPDRRRLALIERVQRCNVERCHALSTLIVTTTRGTVLRRIPDVWEADWAQGRLVAESVSGQVVIFSGRHFRAQRVLVDYKRPLWNPAVSPDGRLVAVTVAGTHVYIAVFSLATGKLVRRLTRGAGPDWSPDGKRIVFSRDPQPCAGVDPCAELFTVRSDGRGQPRSLGVQGVEPTWSVRR